MARTERLQPDLIPYLRKLRSDVDTLLLRDPYGSSSSSIGMPAGSYLAPGLAFTSNAYTGFMGSGLTGTSPILGIVLGYSYLASTYSKYDKAALIYQKANTFVFARSYLGLPFYRDSLLERRIEIGGGGAGASSLDHWVPRSTLGAHYLNLYPSTEAVTNGLWMPGGLYIKSGWSHLAPYDRQTGLEAYDWYDPGAFTSLLPGTDYAALTRCDGRDSISLIAPMFRATGAAAFSRVELRLADWRSGIDPDNAILFRVGIREYQNYNVDMERVSDSPVTLDYTHDGRLILNEDQDTYLQFVGDGNWAFWMGGHKVLDLTATGLKLYVSGGLQTVLCGANDSGGTGYRLLRVANGTGSSGSSDAQVTPVPISCKAYVGMRWTGQYDPDTNYYFGIKASVRKSTSTINCVAAVAAMTPVHKASPVVETINAETEIPTPTLKRSIQISAATINATTTVPRPNFRGRATPAAVSCAAEIPEPNIRGDS